MEIDEPYLTLPTEIDLRKSMRETIAHLGEVDSEHRTFTTNDFRLLARSLKLTLMALSSSLGECQGDIPYSPLRPVRQPDGTLKWCCNHKPEHCS